MRVHWWILRSNNAVLCVCYDAFLLLFLEMYFSCFFSQENMNGFNYNTTFSSFSFSFISLWLKGRKKRVVEGCRGWGCMGCRGHRGLCCRRGVSQ